MNTTQTHRLLDPSAIVPSPTNPRKHFDPAKLAELTIEQFRQMASYEQSKELALWRAEQPPKPEKGAEMILIPMPKGYSAGIEMREINGVWSSTVRVVRPNTTGGVAVPYGCQMDTREEAFAFAVACVLRILEKDMKTPHALLDSVRAWAAKNKVTKADLKKQDAAWKEKNGV